jgi:XTP/dITP diphosphohydrolase
MDLIVASTNYGKIQECKNFLEPLGFVVHNLDGIGFPGSIPEDGQTYQENALHKANAVSRFSGRLVLADDTGLEVDALRGEPGIHSARYGDAGWTDSARNAFLLQNLKDVPLEGRTARFVCVIAIVHWEKKIEHVVTGQCKGIILERERGSKGFGYDPLFYLPDHDKTFAELDPETKNRISHRGRALEKAVGFLEHYRTLLVSGGQGELSA